MVFFYHCFQRQFTEIYGAWKKRFWKALQTSRPTSELAQGFRLTYGLWSGEGGAG